MFPCGRAVVQWCYQGQKLQTQEKVNHINVSFLKKLKIFLKSGIKFSERHLVLKSF